MAIGLLASWSMSAEGAAKRVDNMVVVVNVVVIANRNVVVDVIVNGIVNLVLVTRTVDGSEEFLISHGADGRKLV